VSFNFLSSQFSVFKWYRPWRKAGAGAGAGGAGGAGAGAGEREVLLTPPLGTRRG